MVNLPELKLVQSNITAVRLISPIDTESMNILNQWKVEHYKHYRQQVPNVYYDRLKVWFDLFYCLYILFTF